ncbi:MAG: type 1 glutamine amidotransferase [Oligoflexales bacterium]
MTITNPQIVVLDPAVRTPELEAYNFWNGVSPIPLSYHLPAISGFSSLSEVDSATVAGVMILGSSSSVNDESEWQLKMDAWLRPFIDQDVPIFGFCFGHQMIAKMFGQKCRFSQPDQSKHLGFRKIKLRECLLWPKMEGELVVSHREVIENIPASFEILAESQEVPFDGIRHKTKPIFGLQSHPEVTTAFLRHQNIRDQVTETSFDFGRFLVMSFLKFVETKAKQA